MEQLGPRVRVRAVEPLQGFNVLFTFENGVTKVINLEQYLRGPIFDPLRSDPARFRAMRIDGGTIAWDNGADIDPDVLYYDLRPAWMEEMADMSA
ncbi:MAG: DUF2442 domain-containing protein [Chloroflexi bacterium]|nr:DUF2442 domain-containing protein [Chloroflexota bacterium]